MLNFEGALQIFDWYGGWPSFHDSYMLELHFSVVDQSFIKLHVYRSFDSSQQSEAIVTIFIGRALSIELSGFQDQLLGLTFYRSAEAIRIMIEGALSLNSTIETDTISFALCIWPPENFVKP